MSLSFLNDPRILYILTHLEAGGHQALVVGGAARDGLRGVEPKDIDVATDAHPDRVQELFTNTDVALHPTGLDHGTWTLALDDTAVEVTTFRQDVSTDGRRASVAYAPTYDIDAQRRDFTINALGLDRHGTLYDPTGQGMDDLKAGRVRFVGNAQDRCDEDALRVLRYFRFQGRMGSWPMDTDALQAARNTSLDHISGERIWMELKGICETPQADKVTQAMVDTGVFTRILPNTTPDPTRLRAVMTAEAQAQEPAHWARRLYGLTGRDKLPFPMAGKEARRMVLLHKHQSYGSNPAVCAAASGDVEVAVDAWCLSAPTTKPTTRPRQAAETGAAAAMPLTSKDLMAVGVAPGPRMGALLSKAREQWLSDNLALDTTAFLRTHTPTQQER